MFIAYFDKLLIYSHPFTQSPEVKVCKTRVNKFKTLRNPVLSYVMKTICICVKTCFLIRRFRAKFDSFELKHIAAKLHTFKNNTYHAVTFPKTCKIHLRSANRFNFSGLMTYALDSGNTKKSLKPIKRGRGGGGGRGREFLFGAKKLFLTCSW